MDTSREKTFSLFNATGVGLSVLSLMAFIFVMVYVIYNDMNIVPSPTYKVQSDQQTMSNCMIALSITLIVTGLAMRFVPGLLGFTELYKQISNVTYFFLFTLGAIIFYAAMPSTTLNNYAYIFNPLIFIVGCIALFASASTNYGQGLQNLTYERVKSMVLLFCLLALIITFYSVNPGNAAQKYFGYSLLLTIVMTAFALLYVVILATINPGKSGTLIPSAMSKSLYGFLLLIVVLVIAGLAISNDKALLQNKTQLASIVILLLVACIVWCTALTFTSVDYVQEAAENYSHLPPLDFFKKALLAVLGLVIFGLFIAWFVYNVEGLSTKMGITNFVLNVLLLLVIAGILYKTIMVKFPVGNEKKNQAVELFVNFFLLIECIFGGVYDVFVKALAYLKCVFEGNSDPFLVIVALILFLVVYFKAPGLVNFFTIQGGKLVINRPVYTDSQYLLGNYQQLTGKETFDYQFGISCWIYIDAMPPNTNSNYNQFTSLLNFGNKPNILYNPTKNELRVTMEQKDLKEVTKNPLIDFDNEDNRILFRQKDFLLQKWNNVIINYNSGTLDIFLNGELVKSSEQVVPYYTIDNLTVGENNGIKGGICNVVYFSNALTSSNVYYIYNTLKHKTPPVLSDSTETIIYNI